MSIFIYIYRRCFFLESWICISNLLGKRLDVFHLWFGSKMAPIVENGLVNENIYLLV